MLTISHHLVGRAVLIGTLLGIPALGIASLRGPAQAAAPAEITLHLAHLAMPATVPAGPLTVRVINDSGAEAEASFASLKRKMSDKQAAAIAADGSDAGFAKALNSFTFVGGVNSLQPGAQVVLLLNLTAGRYGVQNGDGKKPVIAFFTVTPSANGSAAVATPAGAYTVQLSDFYFGGLPKTLPAGQVTFTTVNHSPQVHHMELERLDGSKTMADVMKAISSNQQPAWVHDAGGMNLISPGHSASITMTLAPGRYLVACFLPDQSKHSYVAHIMEGMGAIITAS